MCYNAPISFFTFFVGIIISYLIWNRDSSEVYNKNYDYWNSLFILSFIVMQLAEGFTWLGYNCNLIFLIIICSQAIMQCFGNAYFNKIKEFYYIIFIFILTFPFVGKPKSIVVGENKHLAWVLDFKGSFLIEITWTILYLSMLFIPLLWQKDLPLSNFCVLSGNVDICIL